MKPLIEQFKDYLSLSGMTNGYCSTAKKFIKYMNDRQLKYKNFNFARATEYILYVKTLTSEPETINHYLKSLKRFFKFLILNKLATEKNLNEINKIPYQKTVEKIKPRFTVKDLDFLVKRAMIWLSSYIHPLKLKAILYFYYFTGIRRNEILNIARKDIDLEKYTAIVRLPTKNRKEKMVCFNKEVSEMLKSYFAREPEQNTENNAFNLTSSNLQVISNNLKPILKDKNITWHSFRHGFAEMLEENGISITSAQKLLGHSNIKTTMRYYKPKTETAIKEYQDKIKTTNPIPKELRKKEIKYISPKKRKEEIELEDLQDL